MDISSARLTSLLREAMTPQALPSAKADPAKAALVKELVQPPVPSLRPQLMAPALPAPLSVGRDLQVTAAQIMQAYEALAEPNAELIEDEQAPTAAARRPTAEGDSQQRGVPMPPIRADDNGPARSLVQPWPALLAPQEPASRRAVAQSRSTGQGHGVSRSAGAARPQDRQGNFAFTSLAAGLLVMAIVGVVLLMLR